MSDLSAAELEEINKLVESGLEKKVIKVGAEAPDFELPDARGGTLHLEPLLEHGPVVLTFYRGGWSSDSEVQLRTFQGVHEQLEALGAQLVAVSPQTPEFAAADAKEKGLKFAVLSDLRNKIAYGYGLVFQLSEAGRKAQTAAGNPLPKFNGDESWELPMPGTFVIDRDGFIQFAEAHADQRKQVDPKAILEVLRRLKENS